MKKIFSAIISSPSKGRLGGVLFALLATTTLWAYDFKSGDLYYNITSDTTVEVTYPYWVNKYAGLTTATIPETITYNGTTYSVTSIGNDAFSGCSSLTSLTIPNSVTSIGKCAFENCSSLTSITIGNSVTSIGSYAFSDCDSLTSITIPNSVTSIGSYAFSDCDSLTSITIPNSVTSIEGSAFSGCSSLPVENNLRYADTYLVEAVDKTLSTYSIKEGTKWIGHSAFSSCSSLTSITIPNSVTSIGEAAFYDCSSLTSITIPNSVTSIGSYAFSGCTFTKDNFINHSTLDTEANNYWGATIRIGSEINGLFIRNDTIIDCRENVTSVEIPNSVTSIGTSAFFGCSSLTSITIPNSVTSIGRSAFSGCSSLTSITWNAENCSDFTSYYTTPFNDIRSQITEFVFGDKVQHIPAYLCYNMNHLTSITIPNSVTSIGYQAFHGCSSLASMVVESGNNTYDSRESCNAIIETATNTLIAGCQNTIIPNSVTSIGYGAFSICKSLTSITIPNSVTSIGEAAFYYCSSLTSITIPNSVTSIGSRAFGLCESLTSITVEKGNSIYDSRENCNAVIETATNTLIAGCQNTIIPNSVTSIGDYAFYYCRSLTSITIPNSVTSIGYGAFSICKSLTSITIPNSVTSIGDHAFYGCDSLTSITIPNSVTSIGEKAFYACSALTSITIPNSVTSIGDWAFDDCSALTSITWNAENCSDFTGIWAAPFIDISSQITEFVFGDKVQHIPAYLCYDMNHLTSVTIPNSVTSIGVKAFGICSSLTSITIPNSVTSIGDEAFYYCYALDTICIEATTPPILGSSIFSDSIAICYIPCLAKAMYIASKWANYVELFAEYDFEQTSGVCGEQLYWTYANTKLTITGDGAMFDDLAECIPWNWLQDSIRTIEMNEGITYIADDAFNGCFALRELYLPASVQSIGDNAFAGTPRLYEVTCLAPEPPIAEESSFTNYDAYFHAYCDAQRYYSVDPVWKRFHNVECIVNENTVTNNVTITPSDCEATVVWLSNDAAAAYSLVITRNGVTFCTLRFNKYGQLTNIAFAPSHTHNNKQQAAEATSTGYSFTITGLDAGTRYDYQFSVLNDFNESIDEYFGEFTTHSTTAVEQISSAEANCQKLLRDGQLIILRDGKTYNTMGAEIR